MKFLFFLSVCLFCLCFCTIQIIQGSSNQLNMLEKCRFSQGWVLLPCFFLAPSTFLNFYLVGDFSSTVFCIGDDFPTEDCRRKTGEEWRRVFDHR